jgi:predicted aldo/keto reductase-like oxidoreductase
MKTMAGAFHDRERTKPVNCKAALKWVLQDTNITTAIPGITTFDQLSENAAVNAGITMTEEEKSSLLPGKSEGGLYCPGCAGCSDRCSLGLPVPDIMRAYMYAYGYRDARKGKDLLSSLNIGADPCSSCQECTVACLRRFDVRGRIGDIARLASVPEEFLV